MTDDYGRCDQCGCWYLLGSLRDDGDRCGDLSRDWPRACTGIVRKDSEDARQPT